MKRNTTKEILAESFRELAENRPVDKITIQESCTIASVAVKQGDVVEKDQILFLKQILD